MILIRKEIHAHNGELKPNKTSHENVLKLKIDIEIVLQLMNGSGNERGMYKYQVETSCHKIKFKCTMKTAQCTLILMDFRNNFPFNFGVGNSNRIYTSVKIYQA